MIFSFITLAVAIKGLKGLKRTDMGLVFVLVWLSVPVIGLILMSYTISNMWMVHYLIMAAPAMYLLFARGIYSMQSRYAAGLCALVVAALILGRLELYYTKHIRPEWRPAVTYVQAHERPGDVVGIYYGGNRFVFQYYYRGQSRWAPLDQDEITGEHFSGWNDGRVREMLDTFPHSGKRFWLLLSNHDYAGGPAIVDYITKHYDVVEHRYYSQLEMILVDGNGKPVPSVLPQRALADNASASR